MPSTKERLLQATAKISDSGHQRFIVQLQKFFSCLETAAVSDNPAAGLYQSSARQWLFYLQALCRVYKKIQDDDVFEELGEAIKLLEDQLGAIDYWDGWIKEYSVNATFPPLLMDALKYHKELELKQLGELLDKGKWIAKDFAQIRGMMDSLEKIDWHKANKDRKKIAEFLAKEIKKIEDMYHNGEIDFQELETGVHELRRKLRWISIYAQALDGLLQLKDVPKPAALYQKYMTDAIVKSPFNRMPTAPLGIEPIYLTTPNFYALSWIISQIGSIKDEGLKEEALLEIVSETNIATGAAAKKLIAQFIPKASHTLASIPATVAAMASAFINDDKILHRLRDEFEEA
jgi:hypothetical protein